MVVVFVRMELSLLSLAVPPLLAATWAPLALLESVQLLLSELSVVELSELSDVELSELSEDQLLVCVLLSVKFAVWVEVCVLVELSELSVVWVYVELSVAVPPPLAATCPAEAELPPSDGVVVWAKAGAESASASDDAEVI